MAGARLGRSASALVVIEGPRGKHRRSQRQGAGRRSTRVPARLRRLGVAAPRAPAMHRVRRDPLPRRRRPAHATRAVAAGRRRRVSSRCPCRTPVALEDLLGLPTGRRSRERAEDALGEGRGAGRGAPRATRRRGAPGFLAHDEEQLYRADLLHRPYVIVPRIPEEAVRLLELDEDGRYRGFRRADGPPARTTPRAVPPRRCSAT